jgi:hypothetical protein
VRNIKYAFSRSNHVSFGGDLIAPAVTAVIIWLIHGKIESVGDIILPIGVFAATLATWHVVLFGWNLAFSGLRLELEDLRNAKLHQGDAIDETIHVLERRNLLEAFVKEIERNATNQGLPLRSDIPSDYMALGLVEPVRLPSHGGGFYRVNEFTEYAHRVYQRLLSTGHAGIGS